MIVSSSLFRKHQYSKKLTLSEYHIGNWVSGIIAAIFFVCAACPGTSLARENSAGTGHPVITGYGEGLFRVGELLYHDDFEHLNHWRFQIQPSNHDSEPEIHNRDGKLDIYMPARGATVWFQHKLTGPVAIIYKVKASTARKQYPWVVPRDINTFWHASDPETPWDIFDDRLYTGAFSTYHRQLGYYASIGGRNNTTTRFRRYPRTADGSPVEHISLAHRDEQEDYLISPDREHTIQLVAYHDVIQYIVDGEVFYEIREGDTVTVEMPDGSLEEAVYCLERFPAFTEGWFGFRMVRSHHIYSNFRVYRLEPDK